MRFELVEQLNESVKNVYRFCVVNRDDTSYYDTLEAFSWKQARYLAQQNHKGCLIRDMQQITDNKDPHEGEQQLSMFDEGTEKKSEGKWVNKGSEGEHGEFKTKKEADAQRKAMFANGYKG